MTTHIGLSDVQRFWFEIAIGAIASIQAFITAEAVRGEVAIPVMAIFYLGLVQATLAPIKAILGVRDASTARAAKEVKPELDQHRKIPQQEPKV